MKKFSLKEIFISLFLFTLMNSCMAQEENKMKFKNKLANETSPYLLQHASNPVNWYPWGNEALDKAKSENKLVVISIGYAACHWCHVMEHESFEDLDTAAVMNEHFVNIKVDREERPDLDSIYMDAVVAMTGQGGWPLNVIALPDGRPVYAGTYFPKDNWTKILLYFNDLYQKEPEIFDKEAGKLSNAIKGMKVPGVDESSTSFTKKEIDIARPKENSDVSGFLPQEREWIDKFLAAGFLDTFRIFNNEPENYTWWDMITRARERNVGWRIDYFYASENLKSNIKSASIHSSVMGSDHCPIELELKF